MLELRKLDFLDGIELKKATFKSSIFPLHFHSAYSIGIISRGAESIGLRDRSFIVPSSKVVIFNPTEPHSHGSFNGGSWSYNTLQISPELVNHHARKLGIAAPPSIDFENVIEDKNLYTKVSRLYDAPPEVIIRVIYDIVIYLLVNYRKFMDDELDTPYHCEIVEEFREIILANPSSEIQMGKMAKKFDLSPYQLLRLFKRYTGFTPKSYQIWLRIVLAQTLLENNCSQVETSLEAGFYDQSHFIRYFQKYIGVSPMEYVQSFKRGES